jgi:hypothetical protein
MKKKRDHENNFRLEGQEFRREAMTTIERLQEWYRNQCNGEWEHQYGVRIDNLDNPGWEIEIDLTDTELETLSFVALEIHRGEDDWIVCRIEESKFRGFGGSGNLDELLRVFLDWADRHLPV